jgi:formylglycine-generating enzyme required for sulfatase activity
MPISNFHLSRLGALIALATLASTAGLIAAEPPPMPDSFALVPAGEFQMGDAYKDGGPDELPVHTVRLNAFHIQKAMVTKAEWEETYKWAQDHEYQFDGGMGEGDSPDHPVQGLDWFDVVKYCNAKSEKEGLTPCYSVKGVIYRKGEPLDSVQCDWNANGYRLPTEAEWEKAARGGLAGKRFPLGDTINPSQANYQSDSHYSYDSSPKAKWDSPHREPGTSPAVSHTANGYGLYDMAGNVPEWCWDFYLKDYYQASPAESPPGPITGISRVQRGGSWDRTAYYIRVACRSYNLPENGSMGGFRCVRK